MGNVKYSEYEDMYPETVIIRKERYFFTVYGLGALVCHNFFSYKCWKTSNEVVSTGFTEGALPAVCEKLSKESISYLVLVKGEIVAGENFDEKNRFNDFVNVDASDIPYRASKSKKSKDKIVILTEKERKLCDISIKYMERLLDGHHPVNYSELPVDTVLGDENVQRCFSFIVDVLKRVYNGESSNTFHKQKLDRLTYKPEYESVIDKMIQDRELTMTELEAFIKPYLGELFVEDIEMVSAVRISNWLLDNGYLISVPDNKGIRRREASEDGKIIGMTNTLVQREDGNSYTQYKFSPKAQRLIFENLSEIAVYKKKRQEK